MSRASRGSGEIYQSLSTGSMDEWLGFEIGVLSDKPIDGWHSNPVAHVDELGDFDTPTRPSVPLETVAIGKKARAMLALHRIMGGT